MILAELNNEKSLYQVYQNLILGTSIQNTTNTGCQFSVGRKESKVHKRYIKKKKN